MKFSTLQPYLPLSILISSGPSLLSENPRSLWSYCIEDAPTSNRIPSTDPGEIPCFFRIPGSSENCPIHGSSCWGLNRGKMENTFKAIYGKSICIGLSLFLNKLYISYLWRKFMGKMFCHVPIFLHSRWKGQYSNMKLVVKKNHWLVYIIFSYAENWVHVS